MYTPLLSVPSLWRRIPSYCWWFRNPKQPPFGCIKPVINGRFQLPTSTGELILNHPTAWKLTYPLENEGWKMKFPFKMVPFQKKIVHFRGCIPSYDPTESWEFCEKTWAKVHRHHPISVPRSDGLTSTWWRFLWRKRETKWVFLSALIIRPYFPGKRGTLGGRLVDWLVDFFSQKSHPENTLEEAEDYWLLDLFRRSAIAFSGRWPVACFKTNGNPSIVILMETPNLKGCKSSSNTCKLHTN